MRLDSLFLVATCTICTALFVTPLEGQECIGLPGRRGSATLGLEGTDGATGNSARLAMRSGRMGIELERSSLDKFAQDDDVFRAGLRLTWEWSDGPMNVCGVGGAQWTSYEAGNTSTMWVQSGMKYRTYTIDGDYDRLRVPVGLAVGHSFRTERRLRITPFATLLLMHDSERMRWVARGLETRGRTGLGGSLGVTAQMGRLFLRSDLGSAWTADRALSGHSDFGAFQLHVGWSF